LQLHDFYKTLLNLQTSNPALRSDSPVYRIHTSGDEKVLSFLRKTGENEIVVLLNFSSHNRRVELFDHRVKGKFKNVFSREQMDLDRERKLELGAWCYLVLKKE